MMAVWQLGGMIREILPMYSSLAGGLALCRPCKIVLGPADALAQLLPGGLRELCSMGVRC